LHNPLPRSRKLDKTQGNELKGLVAAQSVMKSYFLSLEQKMLPGSK
jgi:hypothetical protein